jgi:rhomboid protease GluP
MARRPAVESPVNPIPVVIIGLFVVIVGVEAMLSLADAGWLGGAAGLGWRLAALQDWGFSPAVWDQVAAQGNWAFDITRRFVTYLFVHGNFTHALFASAILLALGKFVGEAFHPLATLAVFLFAGIVGAAVYGAVLTENLALFGAYPGIYGLVGAFTYILWLRLGQTGQNQLRAFRLIGLLMAAQLLFGVLFGSQPSWIADVGGFVAGFALSLLVSPGGWRGFVARIRRR